MRDLNRPDARGSADLETRGQRGEAARVAREVDEALVEDARLGTEEMALVCR